MNKDLISKVLRHPFSFLKNAIYKGVVYPIQYGKGKDYDAAKYWGNRFRKHGNSLIGVGDEGMSEEANRRMYEEAAQIFQRVVQKWYPRLDDARVLEVGCGSGFYTAILEKLGVKNYTGMDITDVLFPEFLGKFPKYKFVKGDVTSRPIQGQFDLIVMIDVIEHIVDRSKFSSAMRHIRNALADGGMFIVAPLFERQQRHLFHVCFWALRDIQNEFQQYVFSDPIPFRNGLMVTIRSLR